MEENIKYLIELIRKIVLKYLKRQSFEAEVLKVDRDQDTCTVKIADGPEVFGVRLKSEIDDFQSKVVYYPKVGSQVLCSIIDNDPKEAFISQYSEIEEVVLNVPKVTFNGGQLGGLVKIEELLNAVNRLEEKHNSLADQLELLPVPVSGNVSGPPVPGSFTGVKILQTTTRNQLENTKVLH